MQIEVRRPGYPTVYEPGLPEEYVNSYGEHGLIECSLGVCSNCGAVEHGFERHVMKDVCNRCRAKELVYEPHRRAYHVGTLMYHSTHYHKRA